MYLWISLGEDVKGKEIVEMVKEEEIYVDDGCRFFLREYKGDRVVRLRM